MFNFGGALQNLRGFTKEFIVHYYVLIEDVMQNQMDFPWGYGG